MEKIISEWLEFFPFSCQMISIAQFPYLSYLFDQGGVDRAQHLPSRWFVLYLRSSTIKFLLKSLLKFESIKCQTSHKSLFDRFFFSVVVVVKHQTFYTFFFRCRLLLLSLTATQLIWYDKSWIASSVLTTLEYLVFLFISHNNCRNQYTFTLTHTYSHIMIHYTLFFSIKTTTFTLDFPMTWHSDLISVCN